MTGLPGFAARSANIDSEVTNGATGSSTVARRRVVSTGSGMVAGSRVIALMVCSFMSRVPVLSTTFGGAASVRVYETVRPLPRSGTRTDGSQDTRQPTDRSRTSPCDW